MRSRIKGSQWKKERERERKGKRKSEKGAREYIATTKTWRFPPGGVQRACGGARFLLEEFRARNGDDAPGVRLAPETQQHRSRRWCALVFRFRLDAQATLLSLRATFAFDQSGFFLRARGNGGGGSRIVQRETFSICPDSLPLCHRPILSLFPSLFPFRDVLRSFDLPPS